MTGARQRTQRPPMSMQVFDQQVQQTLLTGHSPYTPEQAGIIMGLARRMASGQNVAVSQSWLDVNDLNRVASTLANGRPNPRQRERLVNELSGELHGPIRSVAIRSVPIRTPERTYAYRVTMGERTYEIVSRTEMPARSGSGPAGLSRSRLGLIRRALVERTPGTQVYAVSASGERGAAPLNAAQRQQFARAYVARYNRMERSMLDGHSPEELITVASVRRRPSGG